MAQFSNYVEVKVGYLCGSLPFHLKVQHKLNLESSAMV